MSVAGQLCLWLHSCVCGRGYEGPRGTGTTSERNVVIKECFVAGSSDKRMLKETLCHAETQYEENSSKDRRRQKKTQAGRNARSEGW